MCNRYNYHSDFRELAEFYGAAPIGALENQGEVFPRALAPGLLQTADGDRQLHPMQFALAPPKSDTPSHPTYTNNNTRIEEPTKWPWLSAIETSRCVLPLHEFREACYWGDTEGTEVNFHRVDNELLHVAGIYRLWTSPVGTETMHTMSFLMRPASDYVMDHGHHRQPLFIEPSGIASWIAPEPLSSDAAIQVLRDHVAEPEFAHRHARDMAAGWKKRQSGHVRKRGQQMAAQDACEYPCGF